MTSRTILLLLVTLVCLLTVSASALHVEAGLAAQFDDFKQKFGKTYKNAEEEAHRLRVFSMNSRTALALNVANPHAHFAPNKFADLTYEEFMKQYANGAEFYAKRLAERDQKMHIMGKKDAEPAALSIDWREKNAVTHVKDQGQCGSCWAFSAIGSIEGASAVVGNGLTPLSEQMMVSCDTVNEGCNGGIMDTAFQFIIDNNHGEVFTEESYPYTSGTGNTAPCKSDGVVGAVITGFQLMEQDENSIAQYLSEHGPVSIAVDASTWQLYFGGVVSNCFSQQLNHGVLVVGYDDSANPPYWIIKNSWGTGWGESGYIRLEKGTNQCMLKEYAVGAIVAGGSSTTHRPSTTTTRGPSPTTTHSPAGNIFVQKNCLNSQCSLMCRNTAYETGVCLPVQGGGSAIITCGNSEVVEEIYTSSECTGVSHIATMPLNKCMQSYLGYFENSCITSVTSEVNGKVLENLTPHQPDNRHHDESKRRSQHPHGHKHGRKHGNKEHHRHHHGHHGRRYM